MRVLLVCQSSHVPPTCRRRGLVRKTARGAKTHRTSRIQCELPGSLQHVEPLSVLLLGDLATGVTLGEHIFCGLTLVPPAPAPTADQGEDHASQKEQPEEGEYHPPAARPPAAAAIGEHLACNRQHCHRPP